MRIPEILAIPVQIPTTPTVKKTRSLQHDENNIELPIAQGSFWSRFARTQSQTDQNMLTIRTASRTCLYAMGSSIGNPNNFRIKPSPSSHTTRSIEYYQSHLSVRLNKQHHHTAAMYTPSRRLSIDAVECDDDKCTTVPQRPKTNDMTMSTSCARDCGVKSVQCTSHEEYCAVVEDNDETASMSSVSSSEALEASDIDLAEVVIINEREVGCVETTEDDQRGDALVTTASPSPKVVRFSTLTIREYAICLGDNVTSAGAPITISWDHLGEATYAVVEYDDAVERTRRSKSELQMPAAHREGLLQTIGYSRKEIKEAAKQSADTRKRRIRTNQRLASRHYDEFFEKALRAGARFVGLRR